jgi:non-ribosomal peptide synthetase component F
LCALAAVNFDPHVTQYSAALFNGGRLVIARPGQHMLGEMMGLVVEREVSFLLTVPVLGREYFSSPHAGQCSKLRTVIFCGEPLPKDLVELVHRVVSAVVVRCVHSTLSVSILCIIIASSSALSCRHRVPS